MNKLTLETIANKLRHIVRKVVYAKKRLHYYMFVWYVDHVNHPYATLIEKLLPRDKEAFWNKEGDFIVPRFWIDDLINEIQKESVLLKECRIRKTNADYFVEPVLNNSGNNTVRIETQDFHTLVAAPRGKISNKNILRTAAIAIARRIDTDMLRLKESDIRVSSIKSIFLHPEVNKKQTVDAKDETGSYLVSFHGTEDALIDVDTWKNATFSLPVRYRRNKKWYMNHETGNYVSQIYDPATDWSDDNPELDEICYLIDHERDVDEDRRPINIIGSPIIYTPTMAKGNIIAMLTDLSRTYAMVFGVNASISLDKENSNWLLRNSVGGNVVDPTGIRIVRSGVTQIEQTDLA